MKKRRRPMTAAEHEAELANDPEYVAREQQRSLEQQENARRYAMAAAPIVRELEEAGFRVLSIGDLRKRGADYRPAIPILLRWLSRVSYLPLKEDIVRTLSVPWAKPKASCVLIEEFRRTDDSDGTGLRWAIANALEIVAEDDVLEEVVELVCDPSYGRAREMLTMQPSAI